MDFTNFTVFFFIILPPLIQKQEICGGRAGLALAVAPLALRPEVSRRFAISVISTCYFS